jgi:hypothetical protein
MNPVASRVLVVALLACSGAEPPDFNGCWAFFPPGPKFDEQVAAYVKSADPVVIAASCIAPYKLNEETCRRFAQVGPGAWPEDVVRWCSERYGVSLARR